MKITYLLFRYLPRICLLLVPLFLQAAPVITGLSVNHVPAMESDHRMIIRGDGFTNIPIVRFGSIVAAVLDYSLSEIEVRIPKGVVSTVPVTVTADGETSAINPYSYFAYTGDWTAYFTCSANGRIFGIHTSNNERINFSSELTNLETTTSATEDVNAYTYHNTGSDTIAVLDMSSGNHTLVENIEPIALAHHSVEDGIALIRKKDVARVGVHAKDGDLGDDRSYFDVGQVVPRVRSLASNPNGKEAYCVSGLLGLDKDLIIVDAMKKTITDRIPLDEAGLAIAVTPDGKLAYVTHAETSNVSAIDLVERRRSLISFDSGLENDYVVITPDPAPIALFTATEETVGTATQFDASLSVSPVGEIAKYEWDFGDGSPIEFGKTVSHTYANTGTYDVTLAVTNTAGTSLSQVFTDEIGRQNLITNVQVSYFFLITFQAPSQPYKNKTMESTFFLRKDAEGKPSAS